MRRPRIWRLVMMLACVGAIFAAPALSRIASAQQQPANDANDPALRDYLSANGLLNRGMNDLAAQEYRKFLTAHPAHAKASLARYGLGVALFRLKKHDEAITELTQISDLQKFEFAAEVQLMLGQCQLEKHNYAEAVKPLQAFLAQSPTHDLADNAAALLAEALYRAGDYKSVQAPRDMLASKWPDSPMRERADFFAGLAKMSLEDYSGAAGIFSQMKDRYPKGPFADRVALLLGQSLQRSNDPQKAIAQYRAVLQQAGGEGQPDAMFGLATLLHQQKKADEAAGLLDQLIEKYPQHKLLGPALVLRGRISFEAQKYDDALLTFQTAAKVDGAPRDETAYWLAKCELRRGQFADAAKRLADALHDSPKSPLAAEMTYDRGVALMRADQSLEALDVLKGFSAKFAEHALAPDALYLQAMIEHEQHQYAASGEHCKSFLSNYGSHVLAPSVAFLAAENEFLDDHLAEAVTAYQRFLQDHPNDDQAAKAKFRLGSALYRQQDYDGARAPLTEVVKGRNTPEEFRRGLLMLGDINFGQEKWPDAAALMEDYLSFGADQPGADDALLKLGLSQTRQNKSNEALASFKSLIDQFPQSVHHTQALFETGQILLANKDLTAASNAFSAVLSDSKDARFAPFATNHLASIAMQQEDFAKAAELFDQVATSAAGTDLEPEAVFQRGQALMATKQFKPAGDAFAQLVQKFPDFSRVPQARAQRAIALARQGEEVDALKAIEQVQTDDASKLSPELLAGVMYEKAWCLRELGRNEEAAAAYRELLAAHDRQPVSAHAMLELAEIEAAADHHKEAAELLTRLRALGAEKALDVPSDVKEPAVYRLAVCRFELGQYQDAANLCEELIRDFPQGKFLASAQQFCGEALFKLDKPQQAGEHFKVVVEKFADDPAYGPSMLRLGECEAATDRWEQSEKTFADYLKKFADSELWYQAQFGLGWSRENQKRFDEAMADYKKVIENHGGATAARAQFQIGECLFAQKKFDEAVRELLKVDILYGYEEWSAAALYEAGRCFEELTRAAEARSQFELVQQRFPQSRWAKLAAQRLAAIAGRPVSGG